MVQCNMYAENPTVEIKEFDFRAWMENPPQKKEDLEFSFGDSQSFGDEFQLGQNVN